MPSDPGLLEVREAEENMGAMWPVDFAEHWRPTANGCAHPPPTFDPHGLKGKGVVGVEFIGVAGAVPYGVSGCSRLPIDPYSELGVDE